VIAGLTTPSSGRATVAGVDVAELDLTAWWPQLSWLPQRPVLVPGTVQHNLALLGGIEDPESACAASGFDTVLAELPAGMNTMLGRGGVGLSLGQRQRLGLARAASDRRPRSAAPPRHLDDPARIADPRPRTECLAPSSSVRARAQPRGRGRPSEADPAQLANQVVEVTSDTEYFNASV